MRSLLPWLLLIGLSSSMVADSFRVWPISHHLRTQVSSQYAGLRPIRTEQDYTMYGYNSKRGSLSDNRRFRDPLWRPCLSVCFAGCSMWEGFHLKYCATHCVKRGLFGFAPERFCFDFGPSGGYGR